LKEGISKAYRFIKVSTDRNFELRMH